MSTKRVESLGQLPIDTVQQGLKVLQAIEAEPWTELADLEASGKFRGRLEFHLRQRQAEGSNGGFFGRWRGSRGTSKPGKPAAVLPDLTERGSITSGTGWKVALAKNELVPKEGSNFQFRDGGFWLPDAVPDSVYNIRSTGIVPTPESFSDGESRVVFRIYTGDIRDRDGRRHIELGQEMVHPDVLTEEDPLSANNVVISRVAPPERFDRYFHLQYVSGTNRLAITEMTPVENSPWVRGSIYTNV